MTFAEQISLPLTAYFTVTWHKVAGFDANDPASWTLHHGRLVSAMRSYLDRHGIPLAYVCIRERARRYGAHAHYLIHIPARTGTGWKRHARALRDHVHATCGFTDHKAVHVGLDVCGTTAQRLGVFKYLCKGLNPGELVALPGCGTVSLPEWLGIRPERQAMIPGDRVRCSQNIGVAARKRLGYRDTEDVLSFGRALGAQ